MAEKVQVAKVKGPASYFPSIEKKYGKPIGDWQALVRAQAGKKHMEIVDFLKQSTGLGMAMQMRSSRPRSLKQEVIDCLSGDGPVFKCRPLKTRSPLPPGMSPAERQAKARQSSPICLFADCASHAS